VAGAAGDGRADLVATEPPGADAELWVAPGRGDGFFERWREAGGAPGTKRLLPVPDVNGDDLPELALQRRRKPLDQLSPGDCRFGPPEAGDLGLAGSELGQMVIAGFETDDR
jgi:hypothetical protein